MYISVVTAVSRYYISNVHFSSILIQLPLFFPAILSMTSGYITSDMMVGVGTNFWSKALHVDTFFSTDSLNAKPKHVYVLHTEFNQYIRYITVVWTFYFIIVSLVLLVHFKHFLFYTFMGSLSWVRALFVSVGKKYIFINRIVLYPFMKWLFTFSYTVMYRLFDKGVVEYLGPFGVVASTKSVLSPQYWLQSGLIYHYAGVIFMSSIFLVTMFLDIL